MAEAGPPRLKASRVGPQEGYRPCVGLMLIDPGRTAVHRRAARAAADAWQMPQGGIDPGKPAAAARRELKEEVGTERAELLRESRYWYAYDLPLSCARVIGIRATMARASAGSRSVSPAATPTSISRPITRSSTAGAGRPRRRCGT